MDEGKLPIPPPGVRPGTAISAPPVDAAPPDASSVIAAPALPAASSAPSAPIPKRKPRRSLPPLPPRTISDAEKVALATLETELGGRAKLISCLSQAQLDKDGYKFLCLIADPQQDRLSLAEVCQLGNLSIRRVTDYIKSAVLARAQLISTMRIAEKLPDVAARVMEDALPGERVCYACDGLTTYTPEPTEKDPNPVPVKCGVCRGKGVIPYAPDLAVRKVALTLGGLLDKGGGAKVAITNTNISAHANISGASAGFDRLTQVTDQLLYGSGRDRMVEVSAEEAEIVED